MTSKSMIAVLVVVAGLPVIAAAQRSADPASPAITRVILQDTAAGRAIFAGKGNCYACHGPDAKGTPLAPNLTDTTWLHIDGSLDAIVELVNAGVPTPKSAPAPMPPKGGGALNDAEVRAVADYVYYLSHKNGGGK